MGNTATKEREPRSVLEVPSQPGSPTIVPRDGNAENQWAYLNQPCDCVIVTWDAPDDDGGSPITNYVIERRLVLAPLATQTQWVRAYADPFPETRLALSNLVPGHTYQFRVKAQNIVGLSATSRASEPFTAPYDPNLACEPRFVEPLRDVTALEHERVEFRAEIRGVPPPGITWYKDGIEVQESPNTEVWIHENGQCGLVFLNVNLRDSGDIKCVANNGGGQAIETALLTVETPPRALVPKQYEEGLIFETGDTIRLKIGISGRPVPEITWYHETNKLEPVGRYEIEISNQFSTLKVLSAIRQDRGEYSVRLVSGLGDDTGSILVTITNRPTPPGRPRVTEFMGNSVVLEWDPPEDDGGCEIGNYVVEYFRMGWNVWLKATACRQLSAKLGDLIPGSTYKFRIKAENPYGMSESSPESIPVILSDSAHTDRTWPTMLAESNSVADVDDTTVGSSILPLDSVTEEDTSAAIMFLMSRRTTFSSEESLKEPDDAEESQALASIPLQTQSAPDLCCTCHSSSDERQTRQTVSCQDVLGAYLDKENKLLQSIEEDSVSGDLLSGIGSTTGDSLSKEVSLDVVEDIDIDLDTAQTEGPSEIPHCGFWLPKSPARLFVHEAFVSSPLTSFIEHGFSSSKGAGAHEVASVSWSEPRLEGGEWTPQQAALEADSGVFEALVKEKDTTLMEHVPCSELASSSPLLQGDITEETSTVGDYQSALNLSTSPIAPPSTTVDSVGRDEEAAGDSPKTNSLLSLVMEDERERFEDSKPTHEMEPQDNPDLPFFVRALAGQSVKVGTRARLLAEIKSSSKVHVNWRLNEKVIEDDASHRLLQEGTFFGVDIAPVFVGDEGVWTCEAANFSGSTSSSASLRVIVPKSYKAPEFVEELRALLTQEGTVSLECKVVGIPTPVLKWFKDGQEIKAGDVFALTARADDPTSLGVYTCEAVNCVGKAVSSSKVHVLGCASRESSAKPLSPPVTPACMVPAPVIVEDLFDQKVKVGEGIRLGIRVSDPSGGLVVQWFNKDELKEPCDKYHYLDEGEGIHTLEISPLELEDEGEWKCVVSNGGGQAASSCFITLLVPKNYRPPRFLENLKAILTEEGLVSFECKVVGFPTPQLQWFKDGQELKPGDVYQLSGTNSLGSYSCIARNCMGQATSSAELTVEDIQNQLNEDEKRQLLETNQPPIFLQGLRSTEAKIGDLHQFTVQVTVTPEPTVTWYRDDELIETSERYRILKEDPGIFSLEISTLLFADQADWKCIAVNDFGHSVTSCSLKLSIPRHYKKPYFLEPLKAVLSEEGTVNLECKVIGVPQPTLKWFKDGLELKPGDIHRIISGQDGTCCLGTYTCEAHNCMGESSSSAALVGFEERAVSEHYEPVQHPVYEPIRIARQPSLSTIQEERSSQYSLYETAAADNTFTEISVSIDGKEMSLSLYETPDLTEEEAQRVVELFAEEISEHYSSRNVIELPPLRFTRESATAGCFLVEAIVIDVPLDLIPDEEAHTISDFHDDLETEADIEELSAMEALVVDEHGRQEHYCLEDLEIPPLESDFEIRKSLTRLHEALGYAEAKDFAYGLGLIREKTPVVEVGEQVMSEVYTPDQLLIQVPVLIDSNAATLSPSSTPSLESNLDEYVTAVGDVKSFEMAAGEYPRSAPTSDSLSTLSDDTILSADSAVHKQSVGDENSNAPDKSKVSDELSEKKRGESTIFIQGTTQMSVDESDLDLDHFTKQKIQTMGKSLSMRESLDEPDLALESDSTIWANQIPEEIGEPNNCKLLEPVEEEVVQSVTPEEPAPSLLTSSEAFAVSSPVEIDQASEATQDVHLLSEEKSPETCYEDKETVSIKNAKETCVNVINPETVSEDMVPSGAALVKFGKSSNELAGTSTVKSSLAVLRPAKMQSPLSAEQESIEAEETVAKETFESNVSTCVAAPVSTPEASQVSSKVEDSTDEHVSSAFPAKQYYEKVIGNVDAGDAAQDVEPIHTEGDETSIVNASQTVSDSQIDESDISSQAVSGVPGKSSPGTRNILTSTIVDIAPEVPAASIHISLDSDASSVSPTVHTITEEQEQSTQRDKSLEPECHEATERTSICEQSEAIDLSSASSAQVTHAELVEPSLRRELEVEATSPCLREVELPAEVVEESVADIHLSCAEAVQKLELTAVETPQEANINQPDRQVVDQEICSREALIHLAVDETNLASTVQSLELANIPLVPSNAVDQGIIGLESKEVLETCLWEKVTSASFDDTPTEEQISLSLNSTHDALVTDRPMLQSPLQDLSDAVELSDQVAVPVLSLESPLIHEQVKAYMPEYASMIESLVTEKVPAALYEPQESLQVQETLVMSTALSLKSESGKGDSLPVLLENVTEGCEGFAELANVNICEAKDIEDISGTAELVSKDASDALLDDELLEQYHTAALELDVEENSVTEADISELHSALENLPRAKRIEQSDSETKPSLDSALPYSPPVELQPEPLDVSETELQNLEVSPKLPNLSENVKAIESTQGYATERGKDSSDRTRLDENLPESSDIITGRVEQELQPLALNDASSTPLLLDSDISEDIADLAGTETTSISEVQERPHLQDSFTNVEANEHKEIGECVTLATGLTSSVKNIEKMEESALPQVLNENLVSDQEASQISHEDASSLSTWNLPSTKAASIQIPDTLDIAVKTSFVTEGEGLGKLKPLELPTETSHEAVAEPVVAVQVCETREIQSEDQLQSEDLKCLHELGLTASLAQDHFHSIQTEATVVADSIELKSPIRTESAEETAVMHEEIHSPTSPLTVTNIQSWVNVKPIECSQTESALGPAETINHNEEQLISVPQEDSSMDVLGMATSLTKDSLMFHAEVSSCRVAEPAVITGAEAAIALPELAKEILEFSLEAASDKAVEEHHEAKTAGAEKRSTVEKPENAVSDKSSEKAVVKAQLEDQVVAEPKLEEKVSGRKGHKHIGMEQEKQEDEEFVVTKQTKGDEENLLTEQQKYRDENDEAAVGTEQKEHDGASTKAEDTIGEEELLKTEEAKQQQEIIVKAEEMEYEEVKQEARSDAGQKTCDETEDVKVQKKGEQVRKVEMEQENRHEKQVEAVKNLSEEDERLKDEDNARKEEARLGADQEKCEQERAAVENQRLEEQTKAEEQKHEVEAEKREEEERIETEQIRQQEERVGLESQEKKRQEELIESEKKREEERLEAEQEKRSEVERMLAEKKIQEDERRKAEELKREEEERIKSKEKKLEEERLEAEEQKREEEQLKAEDERRQEEERIKTEEKKREEKERMLTEKKKREEEERNSEEKKRREEELLRGEEERHREDECVKADEKKREEEQRILSEQKKWEEEQLKAEEENLREEERLKDEEKRREEEVLLRLAEKKQREEEERLKAEEERRTEEERIKAEENEREEARILGEKKKREEEERILAEKKKREEEERLKAEEERRKEEKRIKAEEKKLEEARILAEQKKREEEQEEERILAEKKREEEERVEAEEKKREEARSLAENKKREEEERILAEQKKREEEERIKAEEKKREEERIKAEEKKREEARILAEKKREKEERIKAVEKKREEARVLAENTKREEERILAEKKKREEEEEERIQAEEKKREEARILAEKKQEEEERIKAEEKKREEARILAEKKREEEDRIKAEEKKREEAQILVEKRKREEEERILAKKKREEEERIKAEEEKRKEARILAEKKREEEERILAEKKKREEEERIKAEDKKREEERIKAEDKKREEERIKDEDKKREEERLKAEEEKRMEEERIKEEKHREEEERKQAEKKKQEEEERVKAEQKRLEEERILAEKKKCEEEERLKVEKQRCEEEERQKAEKKKREEEKRRKAEKKKRDEEERILAEKKKREEEERKDAEKKREAEERILAERKKREEEERKIAEKKQREEEERLKAEQKKREEEERVKAEEKKRLEEKKRAEEQQRLDAERKKREEKERIEAEQQKREEERRKEEAERQRLEAERCKKEAEEKQRLEETQAQKCEAERQQQATKSRTEESLQEKTKESKRKDSLKRGELEGETVSKKKTDETKVKRKKSTSSKKAKKSEEAPVDSPVEVSPASGSVQSSTEKTPASQGITSESTTHDKNGVKTEQTSTVTSKILKDDQDFSVPEPPSQKKLPSVAKSKTTEPAISASSELPAPETETISESWESSVPVRRRRRASNLSDSAPEESQESLDFEDVVRRRRVRKTLSFEKSVERDLSVSSTPPEIKIEPVLLKKHYEDHSTVQFTPRESSRYEETTYKGGLRDPKNKPKFSTKLRDMEAARGSNIKLTCSVLGSPEPHIEWYKNGFSFSEEDSDRCRVSYEANTGIAILELRNVARDDSGEYTCIAKNCNGRSSVSADLRIRGDLDSKPSPATFVSSLRDSYDSAKDELVLDCVVRGYPQPKITWIKDGTKLHLSSRHRQFLDSSGKCKLVICAPSMGDAGHYTCVADNRESTDEVSAFINVPEHAWTRSQRPSNISETCEDEEEAPTFAQALSDQKVHFGGSVTFHVSVSGSPEPEVCWLFNNSRLSPSSKVRYLTPHRGIHSFSIYNITASDLGTYACRATNVAGTAQCEAILTFKDSSWNTLAPPPVSSAAQPSVATFIEKPDSFLDVARDQDLILACTVAGYPKPSLQWTKGSRDLSLCPRVTIEELEDNTHQLTLKKSTYADSGTYCIQVRNCHGSQRAFCTVRVKEVYITSGTPWELRGTANIIQELQEKRARRFNKDVPGSIPSPPTATAIGKNFVSLSWSKPSSNGGAPIMAYKVEAWLIGEGAHWTELAMSPITSYDAYNLKPEREYLFRITPRNKYGWGEPITSTSPIKTGALVQTPRFTTPLHPQMKVLLGSRISLQSEVFGVPVPRIKWSKDGSEVDSSKQSRYSIRVEGTHQVLSIDEVSPDDDAKFVCEANNAGGTCCTSSRLLVVEDPRVVEADENFRKQTELLGKMDTGKILAPQFTMRPRDRRVQVTYPVRLTCQVVGFPKPEVTWKFNYSPILPDERHTFSVDGDFHTLEISNTKFDDAGLYQVHAQSSQGAITCPCRLIVDGGIKAYIPPIFVHELEDRSVSMGSSINLVGRVEAYPAVGVTWYRDGVRLRPSRKYDMCLDRDGTVTLLVANAQIRDAGVYMCEVTNEMGKAETFARITVKQKEGDENKNDSVELDRSQGFSNGPRFLQKPRSTEVLEGDSLVILCEVVGDPKPDVIWLRDWLNPDYYHAADQFVREGDGPVYRLEIPCVKLDYTGAYSVIARNCHGEAKAVISLQVYAHGQGSKLAPPTATTKLGTLQKVPEISQPLRDLRCCDGDAVTFECRVSPQSFSNIRWEKSGKLLRLLDDFVPTFDGECAQLTIKRVYPEDEGEYTCIAYNELGRVSTSACLIVDVADDKENDLTVQLDTRPPGTLSTRTTPRTTPARSFRSQSPCFSRAREGEETPTPPQRTRVRAVPPKFYSVPHNKIAEVGDTVRFQCSVAGHPSPKVTWDKDYVTVRESEHVSFEERDDVRTLVIKNVTPEDAGLYRVTVENELGRIQANARLEILTKTSYRNLGAVRSGSAGRSGLGSYYPSLRAYTRSSTTRNLGMTSRAGEIRGGSTPRPRYCTNGFKDLNTADGSAQRPLFSQGLKHVTVRDGDSLELSVMVQGTPPLEIVWVRNDKVLKHCEDYEYLYRGSGHYALRIRDTFQEDGGIYFCEAYNAYGEAETWCRVNIEAPVELLDNRGATQCATRKPVGSTSNLENSVALTENSVSKREKPIVSTLKSKPVPLSARVNNIQRSSSFGSGCNKRPLSGVSSQIKLQRTSSLRSSRSTPLRSSESVTQSNDDLRTHKTDKIKLSRPSSSTKLSALKREIKEKPKAQQNPTIERKTEEPQPSFPVLSPPEQTQKLAGGFPEADILSLPVDNALDNEVFSTYDPYSTPAEIVKGPVDISALRGTDIVLEALVIGRPEPAIRWLKGGKELRPSSRVAIRHKDGVVTLAISNITADDSGKYIIMVENEHGADCHYASLAVEGPPDPPAGPPNVCEVRTDGVTLSWYGSVYDGGSMVTGYVVEMCCKPSDSWVAISDCCNSTSYVVQNLTRNGVYSFRVKAQNIHGLSVPSKESEPICLEQSLSEDDETGEDAEIIAPFDHRITKTETGDEFKKRYHVQPDIIGKGRFGVVYRVIELETKAFRAAKYVRCLKTADREKVYQEIDIMNKLEHPKLLQLAAAFELPKEIIMVMEYIPGGELFERVVADDFTLTEKDCILFMRQIVDSVGYMHSKNIVHLDLKPENILCQSATSHQIKLIDFGLARELQTDVPVRVLFGTPEFIPPEIVSYEPISFASDMWAVGVVCYVLLSGLSPFMGDNDADTFANITRADFDFLDEAFNAISQDAKDFISALLIKRPEERLTAQNCLKHKWLAQAEKTMKAVKLPTDRLKKFIIRRKWHKTGNAIRALGRMASLSSSRRNSASSSHSPSRRSSRMDGSLCGDPLSPPQSPLHVRFPQNLDSLFVAEEKPVEIPSNVPVETTNVVFVELDNKTECRSETESGIDSQASSRSVSRSTSSYSCRSDSGMSDCSNGLSIYSHRSNLLHDLEEEDGEVDRKVDLPANKCVEPSCINIENTKIKSLKKKKSNNYAVAEQVFALRKNVAAGENHEKNPYR